MNDLSSLKIWSNADNTVGITLEDVDTIAHTMNVNLDEVDYPPTYGIKGQQYYNPCVLDKTWLPNNKHPVKFWVGRYENGRLSILVIEVIDMPPLKLLVAPRDW